MKRFMVAAAIFATTTVCGLAIAGPKNAPGVPGGPSSASAQPVQASLTTKQRGNIARTLVQKWAQDVREQGDDVHQWALKMGRFVGTANAANVRQALDMPTYTTMMGVLQGQPLTSDSVQKALAQEADTGTRTLGSTIRDTTYTPLPNGRCRIADSRVIASPLPGGVTRGIDSEDTASYAGQGGNGTFASGDGSTNCGIPSFATAVAVSVTVLSNGSEGFFKIFENGKPFQTGSTIYYTSTVSAANDMIVTSCQACAIELSVYSSSSAHYVIDIVGYFIRNEATALECVKNAGTPVSIAAGGGTDNAFSPACPAGYSQLSTECETNSWLMPIVFSNDGTCSARNGDSVSRNLTAYRTCCRIPGR